MLRIDCGRLDSAPDLAAALADAFPPAGREWAEEFANLPRLLTAPDGYAAFYRLHQRLRQASRADTVRPPLLIPARVLTDRLLRWRGEHEDPIGAGTGL